MQRIKEVNGVVLIDRRGDARVRSAVGEDAALQPSACTDPRLSGHADLRMTLIDGVLAVSPGDYAFVRSILGLAVRVVRGSADPSNVYPYDIPYNALCAGGRLFCLAAHTDPEVLRVAQALGKKIVDVRQGYAKCSGIPVGSNGLITSDAGIARAARQEGLDVLSVSNEGVALDGYDTGFIGGAGVCFGDRILFTGDLSVHPDFERICAFCRRFGVGIEYIKGMKLYDYGSPIALF